ncbi:hypothetical protein RhiirC2_860269 [Rhizophagus irregularis]|uniref:Uncharacterized protein n=1 Tax=Rhizophagus irregularis TaxID=588596 RepID=A0A2N1P150_9GLOM|nr:hypothetical protein RhiirC2_860269 [Rhizophagus irregularis]
MPCVNFALNLNLANIKNDLNDKCPVISIDVKNEVKSLKKSSKSPVVTEGSTSPFENFIHNIPLIWKNTPQDIKNKYKILSEEFERTNKSTELVIRSFDPENLIRKSRKRGLKENRTQHCKKKRYKEDTFTLKSKNEAENNKNVAFMESNIFPTLPVVVEPSFPQIENTGSYPQSDNTISDTSYFVNLSFDISNNYFSVGDQLEEFVCPFDLTLGSSENYVSSREYFMDVQDSIAFGSS